MASRALLKTPAYCAAMAEEVRASPSRAPISGSLRHGVCVLGGMKIMSACDYVVFAFDE